MFMKRNHYLALFLVIALLSSLLLTGCKKEEDPMADIPNPEVTITLNDGGEIKLELYPKYAPNTVANFIDLAKSGFYEGLTFHRVITGFMIQGGDPFGDGTGGPDYSIKGEFSANGVNNPLKHERGVISMARSSDYDSAGSQFFIVHSTSSFLDGNYAAFGKIIGEDTPDNLSYKTLDRIANTATDTNDRPQISYIIKSVTVDTKGYKYTPIRIE